MSISASRLRVTASCVNGAAAGDSASRLLFHEENEEKSLRLISSARIGRTSTVMTSRRVPSNIHSS